ncbi:NAD(P)-binding domain-containing protein [Nonomuraea jiangxiensis]|uniref:Pyridine nucleotide-disulphide oxidoreductase n=1 Tax=Nonomuraea jiangxiensis TaxID=633440 RepID=A0A1G9P866_9ACTN|nr:NAD(P)-binding domain-containing protein [Nonomuraea jiangxiensis]SDL94894.1 Pyridine nucleotide-disulphide oxidoreductase [Nonomuraea jiangxiensis]
MRTPVIDVAVVGAGPYGLSVAAHALHAGLDTRVFGTPMRAWEFHMPRGMLLKSEAAASHLGDPGRRHGLDAFHRCSFGEPVPVERFVAYGRWFHARAVGPALHETEVTSVGREGPLFALSLASGACVLARTVVLAVGFLPFAHRPGVLAGLPPEAVTHSSDHHDLSTFAGRDVTVVGAGQSALETATLLAEAGARVRVVARSGALAWNDVPAERRSLLTRVLAPRSGLGAGWPSVAWSRMPDAVRYLPGPARRHIVRTALGPAGSWWLRERFEGAVTEVLGRRLTSAEYGDGVRLRLRDGAGAVTVLETEHVIAATGYRVDVARIGILEDGLRRALGASGPTPRLGRAFETPVAGLYLVGLAAAATFGPAMRFVYGCGFAARRLTGGLVSRLHRPRRS